VIGNLSKISENLKDENYTIGESGKKVFAKGNQIGRIKKRGYTLTDLTKVAMEYDKGHDDSILKHYINQLMKDNRLLENYINRYVPIKTVNELTGVDGSPLTFIVEKSYNKPGGEESEEKGG